MEHATDSVKMQQYRQAARRRETERRAARSHRRQQALAVARRAAHLLRHEFGASRVALFGSAREEGLFFERSDVDIAAWGLSEDSYFRAVSALLSLDASISVDLVRVEEARPSLRAVIEQEGVLL
jgi:predicted nucleotidyltransferase